MSHCSPKCLKLTRCHGPTSHGGILNRLCLKEKIQSMGLKLTAGLPATEAKRKPRSPHSKLANPSFIDSIRGQNAATFWKIFTCHQPDREMTQDYNEMYEEFVSCFQRPGTAGKRRKRRLSRRQKQEGTKHSKCRHGALVIGKPKPLQLIPKDRIPSTQQRPSQRNFSRTSKDVELPRLPTGSGTTDKSSSRIQHHKMGTSSTTSLGSKSDSGKLKATRFDSKASKKHYTTFFPNKADPAGPRNKSFNSSIEDMKASEKHYTTFFPNKADPAEPRYKSFHSSIEDMQAPKKHTTFFPNKANPAGPRNKAVRFYKTPSLVSMISVNKRDPEKSISLGNKMSKVYKELKDHEGDKSLLNMLGSVSRDSLTLRRTTQMKGVRKRSSDSPSATTERPSPMANSNRGSQETKSTKYRRSSPLMLRRALSEPKVRTSGIRSNRQSKKSISGIPRQSRIIREFKSPFMTAFHEKESRFEENLRHAEESLKAKQQQQPSREENVKENAKIPKRHPRPNRSDFSISSSIASGSLTPDGNMKEVTFQSKLEESNERPPTTIDVTQHVKNFLSRQNLTLDMIQDSPKNWPIPSESSILTTMLKDQQESERKSVLALVQAKKQKRQRKKARAESGEGIANLAKSNSCEICRHTHRPLPDQPYMREMRERRQREELKRYYQQHVLPCCSSQGDEEEPALRVQRERVRKKLIECYATLRDCQTRLDIKLKEVQLDDVVCEPN